jgi:Cu(I)/Ag(I) efflux system periplasmic protein CusF
MNGPAYDNLQGPHEVLLIAHDGSTQVFSSDFHRKGTPVNHQRLLLRAAGLALVLSATAVPPALAAGNQGAHAKRAAQAFASDMTDGEVRKVDKEGGKLTLKHADIKSLDMPAMTMVFVVKDKAMLDKVKAGDKVKFKAINDAGKYTVTEMQVTQYTVTEMQVTQ